MGDVTREFLRGAVALYILHHAAEGAVHGAWMSQELGRHGYAISPGTLYPTLHRMRAAGMLEVRDAVVGGHRRRLYHTTAAGERALDEMRRALRELAHEVLTDA